MPDVEKGLNSLRDRIPVNRELKGTLRGTFTAKASRPRGKKRWFYIAAVAAALAITIGGLNGLFGSPQQTALAAELLVTSQYSFIDLTSGQHGAPAVHDDKLYLPIYGQGIALFDSTAVRSGDGLTSILNEPNVSSIAISHSGHKLAYVLSKGIYIYDLESQQTATLVEGNDYDVYYEDPSWNPEDLTLLVTRRTVEWLEHGFEVKAEEIIEVSLNDGTETKITDGTYASMAPDKSYIIFTRDKSIYMRGLRSASLLPWQGLKAGQEKLLGPGMNPSISPDGRFIAYVKLEESTRKLSDKATVRETIGDVFVANVQEFADQRQITANYAFEFIDETEWAQGVQSNQETLEIPGFYTYFNPVWSSDSNQLYILKNGQDQFTRLMRVDLQSPESGSPIYSGGAGAVMTAVVNQYLEALVNRDVDTARSLYQGDNVPPFVSNPHPIGYAIKSSGAKDSREYVDALQFVAYEGEPYYQVVAVRFYMQRLTRGYVIAEVVQSTQLELYAKEGTVYSDDQALFSASDVGEGTFGPLVYDQALNRVYFAWYTGQNVSVRSFDLETKRVSHVFTFNGEDINVTNLGLNSYGPGEEGFLAINFMSDQEHRALLYSLQWNQPVQTLGRANRVFWAGSKLLCYTENSGGMVRWEYDPITGTSRIWPE